MPRKTKDETPLPAPGKQPGFDTGEVVVETGDPENPNAASAAFADPETGVYDATPEGKVPGLRSMIPAKPPLNPITKSYKSNFPARNNGGLQRGSPMIDAGGDK